MAGPLVEIVNIGQILHPAALILEDDRLIHLSHVLFAAPNFTCFQWLAARRLIANSCRCLPCGFNMRLVADRELNDGFNWRCPQCRSKKSVRLGSFFSRSHLSLQKLVAFIYMWSVDTPLKYIMHELEITQWNTVVDWSNFCRDVCVEWLVRNPVEIGGLDHQGNPIEVEIDESYYFHRKYHRGQIHAGKWVFGGIERGSGRCFTEVVPRRDAATLLPLIQRHILPGSRIISDMWAAYANVNQINNGVYLHDTVNHTLNFVDPVDDSIHTQNIEGMWAHAKRKLRYQFGTSRQLFPTYLDEFVWKKAHPERKFANFLQCITEQYPV